MKRSSLKQIRKAIEKENRSRPTLLTLVPRNQWPEEGRVDSMIEVWISSRYLAQVFSEGNDVFRISVNRTILDEHGQWQQNLSWDELMEVKRQIGRGESYAVEVLPPDADIVNVANMRHFWILPVPVCGWKRK